MKYKKPELIDLNKIGFGEPACAPGSTASNCNPGATVGFQTCNNGAAQVGGICLTGGQVSFIPP